MNFLFFNFKYFLYFCAISIGTCVFYDLNLINYNLLYFIIINIFVLLSLIFIDFDRKKEVLAIIFNLFCGLVFVTYINEYLYLKPLNETFFFRFLIKNPESIIYTNHHVLSLDYNRLNSKFNLDKFAQKHKFYEQPVQLSTRLLNETTLDVFLDNLDYYRKIIPSCGKSETCFNDFKNKLIDKYQAKLVKYDKRNYHYYVK